MCINSNILVRNYDKIFQHLAQNDSYKQNFSIIFKNVLHFCMAGSIRSNSLELRHSRRPLTIWPQWFPLLAPLHKNQALYSKLYKEGLHLKTSWSLFTLFFFFPFLWLNVPILPSLHFENPPMFQEPAYRHIL